MTCYPFAGAKTKIATQCGNRFENVNIRLNGRDGPNTKDTAIWKDQFKVASLVIPINAIFNPTDGKGVNRIGRSGDVDCAEFAGYLTELLVWSTALSGAEVEDVEKYLLQKYKISEFEVQQDACIVIAKPCTYSIASHLLLSTIASLKLSSCNNLQ